MNSSESVVVGAPLDGARASTSHAPTCAAASRCFAAHGPRLGRLLFALLLPLAGLDAAPAAEPDQPLRPPPPGRFKPLFQPFRTDTAALSPDGRHLAYSVREGDSVSVLIFDVTQPGTIKSALRVIDDQHATPMLAVDQRERTPGRINWMRWVTPTRLVLETNQVFARAIGPEINWQSWRGAVFGVDADGANGRLLASPTDFPELLDGSDTGGVSARRDRRPLAPTPDQPPAAPAAGEIGAQPEPSTASAESRPRTLRIYGLDPRHPGAVLILATGANRDSGFRSLSLHSLDAQTGRLTELHESLVPETRDALLDRQGRARVALPNSFLSSFPFRYEYLGLKGQDRPRPLDEAAGLPGFAVSPDNFFGARAIPLGFAEDPNILYYASNLGRDTYGIYSLELATGQRGSLTLENPVFDLIRAPDGAFPEGGSLVFDRYSLALAGVRFDGALRTTAWLRPEWQALQAELEGLFPGRCVDLADWDEAGRRFLVATEGPADPGAYYLYDRETRKLLEFVRRAPWIEANHAHLTLPFSFATKDGARLSGLVTAPRQPRLKPIPMVVLCPDLPWRRVSPDFQTEIQALADMGFVVVQLNGRGAWGLGLRQRRSLTAGYDLVQIEDLLATIAALEQRFQVNPQRVALLGRGHGGFIALRALQAHPDRFRCAIALDAPVDLADWLAARKWAGDDVQSHLTRAWLGDAGRLQAAPLTRHPETITRPVLLLSYPGRDGAPRLTTYAQARSFAAAARRHGAAVEFADLHTDYLLGLPAARAEVFDRLEEFLNLHVYDFNVKVRDLEILPEPKP